MPDSRCIKTRFWGKHSLDYLWYGISVFLAKNPHCRHLFGPVSISGTMPQAALAKEFSGDGCAEDFKQLKQLLQNMGASIPPPSASRVESASWTSTWLPSSAAAWTALSWLISLGSRSRNADTYVGGELIQA